VSLFSDRNIAAAKAAGDALPEDIRLSLIDWFAAEGVRPEGVWTWLKQEHGFGEVEHVRTGIAERFGEPEAIRFDAGVRAGRERAAGLSQNARWIARGALAGLPTPLFLDALEGALALLRETGTSSYASALAEVPDAVAQINRVFARRGVAFRAGSDGKMQWVGDAGAQTLVVAPALEALRDLRLGGARVEFETALRQLRAGSDKDLEQAGVEAAKAVESSMKALLDAHGVERDSRAAAQKLWLTLREANLVPAESEAALLGALRIRNVAGAHGAGGQPRQVPAELAVLTVQSAAAAIVYLATLLP
jgi:hypothetical protein